MESAGVKRGEIWTVAGDGEFTGKPRPAVIVQDNRFDDTASVTICALTTSPVEATLVRPHINPSSTNGLQQLSRVMVDKVTTVSRKKLGYRIGQLDAGDLVRVDRALIVFLGLIGAAGGARLDMGQP